MVGSKLSLHGTNLKTTGYSLGLKNMDLLKLRGMNIEPAMRAYFLNCRADSGDSMSSKKALWSRCWMLLMMVLHLAGGFLRSNSMSSRFLRALLILIHRLERSAGDWC